MQPIRYLDTWLSENFSHKQSLFKTADLRALFPHHSDSAYKTLLSRATSTGIITRVCRSVYFVTRYPPRDGLLLFKTATLLRSNDLNYISLETALSDLGIISQVPINWITIMSSGRSNTIDCHEFGTIEFVQTKKQPSTLKDKLVYDSDCGMWRAKASLALQDMKQTKRNCDLIDWDIANEFI